MEIEKTVKARARGKMRPSGPMTKPQNARLKPNVARRNGSRTGYEEKWGEFIDTIEEQLAGAAQLPSDLGKSPYYAPSNIVKRAVYTFVRYARKHLKPGPLEDTIDASRAAKAADTVLRTLRKDFKKEPYYWVLTGLHLDCPAANLRKSDVTRFAQHLNYAHRHRVPPEYLIGFLLQTGSLAEVYRRALDPDRREQWFIEQANS